MYIVENYYSSEGSFYNYVRFRTRRPKQICSTFRATSSSIKFNWENQQFSCHETDVLFFKKMKKMNLPMLVFIFKIYIICVHRYTRHCFGDVYQHFQDFLWSFKINCFLELKIRSKSPACLGIHMNYKKSQKIQETLKFVLFTLHS